MRKFKPFVWKENVGMWLEYEVMQSVRDWSGGYSDNLFYRIEEGAEECHLTKKCPVFAIIFMFLEVVLKIVKSRCLIWTNLDCEKFMTMKGKNWLEKLRVSGSQAR